MLDILPSQYADDIHPRAESKREGNTQLMDASNLTANMNIRGSFMGTIQTAVSLVNERTQC